MDLQGQAAAPARDTNPRKELMREQILDTAARMFDDLGYERCSMAAIAQELGLGRSAIYHYFGSKEEILMTLIEAEALTPSHRLTSQPIPEGASASALLREVLVEGVVRRLASGARFVRLSRLEAQIPSELRGGYDNSRRAIYEYYLRCIEHGVATGEFRQVDAHVAAFSVIGMANWTSRWFRPDGRLSAEEVANEVASMALASLRSDNEQSRILDSARQKADAILAEAQALHDLLS